MFASPTTSSGVVPLGIPPLSPPAGAAGNTPVPKEAPQGLCLLETVHSCPPGVWTEDTQACVSVQILGTPALPRGLTLHPILLAQRALM